ncbi:hypothetical protein LPB138_04805 [Urechidicola croceus]|uniref:Uncharacterized protein n=1 Tax=Urechidicola croceus TaxID=1850246 RepID=A0A1D8P679_9FLAO|nr:hypothetical protein LPB138_04805 [Urechidicola croceus]
MLLISSINSFSQDFKAMQKEYEERKAEAIPKSFKIISPIQDFILVDETRTFTIEMVCLDPNISILLLGFPYETYATKHNLERPADVEEIYKLPAEEQNKFFKLIPSIEVIETIKEGNKITIYAKVTSENIEEFNLDINNYTYKTFRVLLE